MFGGGFVTRQEQAIDDFKRKPHYADPYEYWKKKQEESKNEQK
nr:MAG TPA: hypothetical protein [Bacteriophage sp.]